MALRPKATRRPLLPRTTSTRRQGDLIVTIVQIIIVFMMAPTIARLGTLSANGVLAQTWSCLETIMQGAGEDLVITLQLLIFLQILGNRFPGRSLAGPSFVALYVSSAPVLCDLAVQLAGFTRVTRNEVKDLVYNMDAMWSSIRDRLFSTRALAAIAVYFFILYWANRVVTRSLKRAPESIFNRLGIAVTATQIFTLLNMTIMARSVRPFKSSYMASNTVFVLEFGAVVPTARVVSAASLLPTNSKDPLASIISPSEVFTRQNGNINASFPMWRRTESFQGDTRFDLDLNERRPNIILMNLESWSDLIVGPVRVRNGSTTTSASFTPFYDKWSSRGIRFDSHYSNGIQTSNSLYTQLLSVKPRFTYEPAMEDLVDTMRAKTLPNILGDNGYHCEFMSAASFSWHRWSTFLERAGFHEQHDSTRIRETLKKMEHAVPDEGEHGWGLHDEYSLLAVEKRIAELAKEDAPFFLDWYSISTHDPYNPPISDEDMREIDPLLQLTEAESDRLYMQSVRYADRQVGTFLDRLEARGLLENTIVMIMGDHGRMVDGASWSDPAGPISSYDPYSHVPMSIIPSPDLLSSEFRGTVVNHISCHYDIISTIADMVALPAFEQHGLGSSLRRVQDDSRRILVDQPWWGHPYLLVISDHLKFVFNMDEDSTECRVHERHTPANSTECDTSRWADLARESRNWAESLQRMNNIGYDLSAFMP